MKRTKKTIHFVLLVFIVLASTVVGCKKKQAAVATESTETTPPAATAESTPQESPQEAGVFATYERTPCYGQCPIFKLTIYTDGKAVYEGRNWVNMIGTYRTVVSKSSMERLLTAAKEVDYFSMKEEYNNEMVTDLPSVITEVSNDGVLKRVRNRRGGPASLKTLYGVFDTIVAESFWTKEETKD